MARFATSDILQGSQVDCDEDCSCYSWRAEQAILFKVSVFHSAKILYIEHFNSLPLTHTKHKKIRALNHEAVLLFANRPRRLLLFPLVDRPNGPDDDLLMFESFAFSEIQCTSTRCNASLKSKLFTFEHTSESTRLFVRWPTCAYTDLTIRTISHSHLALAASETWRPQRHRGGRLLYLSD